MTANAFAEDVQMAYAAGVNGHLTKPLDTTTVLHTLARVCGKG